MPNLKLCIFALAGAGIKVMGELLLLNYSFPCWKYAEKSSDTKLCINQATGD
jgi:hypothetical protein